MGKRAPDSGPMYLTAMLQAQQMASNQIEQQRQDAFQQQQFEWAQQAYRDSQAQAAPINAQQLKNMQQQYDIAQQQRDRYNQVYVPLEDQYISTAKGWDTPEAEANAAAQAQAAVAQQVNQARAASARNLQAYGVDPGAARYASLDIGTRTAGAAAEAGAGNQAINQRQLEGVQLLQNAAGMGRGLPATALNAYAGSNASGTGVIGNTNAINQTGGSLMGTAPQYAGLGAQYAGLASQNAGQIGQTFNNLYTQQTAAYDANVQGLYGLAGAVVGGASNMMRPQISLRAATGGVIPQGVPVGPNSGPSGTVPVAASPSQGVEVDDVPARLTPGEFVVPKDVVQWKGEEHFQKLIEQSREKKQQAVAVPQVKPALPIQRRA
jgi:hypothetical protein